jgi:hypothetical protein
MQIGNVIYNELRVTTMLPDRTVQRSQKYCAVAVKPEATESFITWLYLAASVIIFFSFSIFHGKNVRETFLYYILI